MPMKKFKRIYLISIEILRLLQESSKAFPPIPMNSKSGKRNIHRLKQLLPNHMSCHNSRLLCAWFENVEIDFGIDTISSSMLNSMKLSSQASPTSSSIIHRFPNEQSNDSAEIPPFPFHFFFLFSFLNLYLFTFSIETSSLEYVNHVQIYLFNAITNQWKEEQIVQWEIQVLFRLVLISCLRK